LSLSLFSPYPLPFLLSVSDEERGEEREKGEGRRERRR
jgi:hypothetical protein